MRPTPNIIASRLAKQVQTKATNADPRLSLWISRPVTQLTHDELLEKQPTTLSATGADIAVQHTKFGRTADAVYLAYISGGVAKVVRSPYYEVISRHTWTDTGFSEPADSVAICFDGTMPRNLKGKYEFITHGAPWVFWTHNGACYGKQLGGVAVELASANCTAVSACRAMWSDVPGFDFGLCLFMVLSGAVYYRQLIDGEWYDAAPVPVDGAGLPSGHTWAEIAATRTEDYRVILTARDTANAVYEIVSQFGGIGSKNAEHIEIKDITASGTLTEVTYHDGQAAEHIEISNITAGALYGGLYSTATPAILIAENADDGNGDWGKIVRVAFDVHLNAAGVAAQASAFGLTDSSGKTFAVGASSLDADGKTVILSFGNINNARGELTVSYTPGAVTSMAGTALVSCSTVFTPTGLVPQVPPAVTTIENI